MAVGKMFYYRFKKNQSPFPNTVKDPNMTEAAEPAGRKIS